MVEFHKPKVAIPSQNTRKKTGYFYDHDRFEKFQLKCKMLICMWYVLILCIFSQFIKRLLRPPLGIYTQSQKKRTMNSLTCPVSQGRGQVPPAGSSPTAQSKWIALQNSSIYTLSVTGISSTPLTMLFHCYKYLYYIIINPWVCSGVVSKGPTQLVKATTGGQHQVWKLVFWPPVVALTKPYVRKCFQMTLHWPKHFIQWICKTMYGTNSYSVY